MTRLRRQWRPLTVTVVLTGLTVNAGVQAGAKALLVLALAAIGCPVAVFLSGYTSASLVVRHSWSEQRAVEAVTAQRAIEARRRTGGRS